MNMSKETKEQEDASQLSRVIGCDSGWIKCSDRLPKKHEIVDVWKNNQYCTYKRVENILFDGEWFCDLISHYGRDEITHWMPLPEPPNHG